MRWFTDTHEWVEIHSNEAVIGITEHAVKEIGQIVFILLPKLGAQIALGQEVCVLESTKAAIDIYCPISGKVLAVNDELVSNAAKINTHPEKEGWLFRLQITNPQEVSKLMDQTAYNKMIMRADRHA